LCQGVVCVRAWEREFVSWERECVQQSLVVSLCATECWCERECSRGGGGASARAYLYGVRAHVCVVCVCAICMVCVCATCMVCVCACAHEPLRMCQTCCDTCVVCNSYLLLYALHAPLSLSRARALSLSLSHTHKYIIVSQTASQQKACS
jgi:hypothetical protein